MHKIDLPLLVKRINHISKVNDETFRITIEVRPTTSTIYYDLEVYEANERHVFVSGTGETIYDAVWTCLERIPAALESWGYV